MMTRIWPGRLALVILLMTFGQAAAEIGDVSVKIGADVEKVGYFTDNNITYISMSQLAPLFGDRLSWVEVGRKIALKGDQRQMTFFVNSPYMRIEDSVKNITYAARLKGGQLYLPAETFIPLFDRVRTEKVAWDSHKKTIRVESGWSNVTDITFSPKANGLLIEIFLTDPLQYEIFTSEGNWLNVTIAKGVVNQRQLLSRRSDEFLTDMNVFQFEGSTQISLRLRRDYGKFSHRLQPDPDRIQISLIDTLATAVPIEGIRKVGPGNTISKIIIDPGHGGNDYGAIGLKSTREKEVVLDIARRLAKLIRKEKIFEVDMTRDRDEYVSLDQRAEKANKSKGEVFVSIHANASLKRPARGYQVFFLAPAKNDSARAAAQLENAPFLAEKNSRRQEEGSKLEYIISDMIQTEFQSESADLAGMVDRELRKTVRETEDRGIDQAGFFVLNGVFMPSILVETAFITNSADEKLLNNRQYRDEVAQAIYDGLKRFKAKYEGR